MIEILPAILPKSFADLQEHIERLQGVAPRVQVDVVDGVLAHGKTWPYRDSSTFEKLVSEEHGLPQWDKVDYQFDLMIDDPMAVVDRYSTAGATSMVLHARAKTAAEALQTIVDRRDEQGSFSVQVGVAIGPHDQLETLMPYEAQFDFVQVMGIAHIGKQGEPYEPHTAHLVERIRGRYPKLPIQVDGGVGPSNAKALVSAGATRFIAGSAIFDNDDPVHAYKALYNLVNGH